MSARSIIESFEAWGILAEPNTPAARQFGAEKQDRLDANVLHGEFGTLRAVRRENGRIIGGVVVGRRNNKDPWQLLLMQVRPEFRRQGVARELLRKVAAKIGKLKNASEYSEDGKKFADANINFFMHESRTRPADLLESKFTDWFAGSKVVDANGKPLRVYHGTNQPFKQFSAARKGASTRSSSSKEGIFFTDNPDVAAGYADMAARHVVAGVSEFEKKRDELRRAYERLDKVAERTQRPQDFDAAERAMEAWETHETDAIQDEDQGQNVFPAYLKMLKPLELDAKQAYGLTDLAETIKKAKAAGHDGIIIRNSTDNGSFDSDLVSDHYVVFSPRQVRSAIGAQLGESRFNTLIVGQISRAGDVQFKESNLSHPELKMVGGKPWRYALGRVYWHEDPSEEEKFLVTAALEDEGRNVRGHTNFYDLVDRPEDYSKAWALAHGLM